MKNKKISLAVTIFAVVMAVSFVCFNEVRAGLFSSKPKASAKSSSDSKKTAEKVSAPEKKKTGLLSSKPKTTSTSEVKKTAETSKTAGTSTETKASTAPEKKKSFSLFKSKPKAEKSSTSETKAETKKEGGTVGSKEGETKESAPKKKSFLGGMASSIGSSTKKAASKAASAVGASAKKAVVAVGKQAAKAAVSVGKAAETILKAAQHAVKELYAQLKNFNLESEQLNMTIPVTSKDEAGADVVSELGFVYHFGYTGLGDPNEPFAIIPGEFQSSGGILGMIPVDLFMSKMPGEVGALFQEIKVLSPKMHFFLKFVAACNSLGLISQNGAKVPFDDEKRKQLMASLTMLLSRLDLSSPPDAPKLKPSDIINKLPKFLHSFIESIDMPDAVTEYDVAWERDCGGKPISAMRKEIANMRSALVYSDRTLIGEEKIIPLLEGDVVSNLTATDFNWLAYALKHHLYDLDKGSELQAMDAGQRREEINNRAGELVILYSEVLSRIPDDYQVVANDLYAHLAMFAHEVEDEHGTVWAPLESIEIKIEKPLMGGDAESKQVTLPLSRTLDIMFAKIPMLVNQPFEIDGVYPDGNHLWDDSNLSKSSTRDIVMAIALRAIKEKNNEAFNSNADGVKGFVQYELAKLYNRSAAALDSILSLLEPMAGMLQPIIGDPKELMEKVKTMADGLVQGVATNQGSAEVAATEEVALAE